MFGYHVHKLLCVLVPKQLESGLSLVEILTSIAMLSIVIGSVVAIMPGVLSTSALERDQTLAYQYAREGVEQIRHVRDSNSDGINNLASGTYCLNSDGSTTAASCHVTNIGIFKRELAVLLNAPECGGKITKVTVTVSWKSGKCSNGAYCNHSTIATCLNPSFNYLATYITPIQTTTPTPAPPIQHDADSSKTFVDAFFAQTMSWPHTTGNFPNRIMVVGLANDWSTPSSVSYAGQALTQLASYSQGGLDMKLSLWYLKNPPIGTANVVVRYSMNAGIPPSVSAGASTFYNVNQATPVALPVKGPVQSLTASNTTPGQVVVDTAANFYNFGSTSITPNALQTQLYNLSIPDAYVISSSISHVGSYKTATGNSTTMNWTSNGGGNWLHFAVILNQ